MQKTMLQYLYVEGFRSIKSLGEAGLELKMLNVVIGSNGAGKSNLISVFKLLDRLLQGHLQEYVGQQGGASRLIHHGPKITKEIDFRFEFGKNGYWVQLTPTLSNQLMFKLEQSLFRGNVNKEAGDYFGSGYTEAKLPDFAVSELPKRGISAHVMDAVTNWVVYHFHDTSELAPPKLTQPLNDNHSLKADGGNIAPFLFRLKSTHPHNYKRIVEVIRMIAPFFDDFRLSALALRPSDIKLEWKQKGTDAYFDGSDFSDGTLRFICLATLLLQPPELMPSLLLIDEPELGLHPAALTCLAELIYAASKNRQILLATQSPTLLDHFQPEDIIVAEQHDGASVFKRLEPEKLSSWLEEYTLGELWLKNVMGGRP